MEEVRQGGRGTAAVNEAPKEPEPNRKNEHEQEHSVVEQEHSDVEQQHNNQPPAETKPKAQPEAAAAADKAAAEKAAAEKAAAEKAAVEKAAADKAAADAKVVLLANTTQCVCVCRKSGCEQSSLASANCNPANCKAS